MNYGSILRSFKINFIQVGICNLFAAYSVKSDIGHQISDIDSINWKSSNCKSGIS